MVKESRMHFVLVHGLSHGAWCWYQVATLLRSDGHKVTVPDLAASGINLKRLDEVQSVHDYFQPLMEIMASLNPDERVIVVGHSFAGIGVALAMEKYPEKILVAVFPSAVMPGLGGPPLAIIKEELNDTLPAPGTGTHPSVQPGSGFLVVAVGSTVMHVFYPRRPSVFSDYF